MKILGPVRDDLKKTWKKNLILVVFGAVVGALTFSVLAPLALYWLGLGMVPELPAPPAESMPEEVLEDCWLQVEKTREIELRSLTPWAPVLAVLERPMPRPFSPGERAAIYASQAHVHETAGKLATWKWHVATSAVAIWITRNWSALELAHEVVLLEPTCAARI